MFQKYVFNLSTVGVITLGFVVTNGCRQTGADQNGSYNPSASHSAPPQNYSAPAQNYTAPGGSGTR